LQNGNFSCNLVKRSIDIAGLTVISGISTLERNLTDHLQLTGDKHNLAIVKSACKYTIGRTFQCNSFV